MDYPGHAGVLDHLNLTLAPGSYTLIAGPTGSGKSTLALALIGALEAATHARLAGTCRVLGQDMTAAGPAAPGSVVAAVWQKPSVQLFRPTVLDEVRSGLDYRELPAAEATARARKALELVGLDRIGEGRDPATLSGGEQQRLALAAALVLEAPVLVLDEATSALDAHALTQFTAALDRARASREFTVVAVDHRLTAHLGRAGRLVVLDEGRIALDGPPPAVLANPRALTLGLRLPDDGAAGTALTGLSGPPVLECAAAGVRLGSAVILAEVTLALPRGAVALLTGDNGTGKSTLLRLLATEPRSTVGRVLPGARARVKAGIGYAPQRAAELMLTRTVTQEVASAGTDTAGRAHVRAGSCGGPAGARPGRARPGGARNGDRHPRAGGLRGAGHAPLHTGGRTPYGVAVSGGRGTARARGAWNTSHVCGGCGPAVGGL